MRHLTIMVALLFGVLLLPLSLLGCSGNQGTQAAPTGGQADTKSGQEATLTQQIKAIDDNTHMPPEAKEAAKANIQRGQKVDMSVRK